MQLLLPMAKQGKKLKWREGYNVVNYTRVSDPSQFDNSSLETQRKDAERYAEKRGLFIKKYFGGVVDSAKTDERKEFKRMLDYVKKDTNISAILVYSYERFSRSEYSIQLSRDLAKMGIKILSVIQEVDVTSPSGRLQQDIFFAFGNYDNELRRNKSVRGMVENLLNGYWVSATPFGYTNLRRKEKAKYHEYVINRDGEILRSAFKWKAEGKMNNLEIVNRMINLGSSIEYKSFVRIISNPFYCGYVTHSLIPGKIIKGHHPALVTEDLYLGANNIVDNNPHKGISKKYKNAEIPLKSFLKTEDSELPFTGYLKKGHYYYKTRGKGGAVNARADFINDLFKRELLKYTINEKYEDRIEQEVMKLVFEKLDEQLKEQSALKRKLTELKDKIEKLEIRFIDHDISKELFEKYNIQYNTEIEELKQEISSNNFESSNLEKAVKKGIKISRNPLQLWISSDYDEKQRLQYLMFPEGIRYNKEKREVRTPRVNSIFSLIAYTARVSEDENRCYLEPNSPNSHLVVPTRIELVSKV